MARTVEPPSGTRDFLGPESRRRRVAFAAVADVFERYGFDPLETPAFERLEVFDDKLGEDAAALIFKILKRGVHAASGEADLALRYDHTVPLARVVATYGNRLPMPYKRYTIDSVWRADRPAKGRFREFVQCDVDIVGSTSALAEIEIVSAVHDALIELGVADFRFLVNSRQALSGLLDAYGIAPDRGGQILSTLDKLDKLPPDAVWAELKSRDVDPVVAEGLVADLISPDTDRIRKQLDATERGRNGLAEIDRLIELAGGLPAGRVVFSPRLVRGLDYYTGPIFEVVADGFPGSIAAGGRYDGLVARLGGPDLPACGGSIGVERILALQEPCADDSAGVDVAMTVMGAEDEVARLAGEIRKSGLLTSIYLGTSGKLARQLKWANEQRARVAVLYGPQEQADHHVTMRDMASGGQTRVPFVDAAAHLASHYSPQEPSRASVPNERSVEYGGS